MPAAGDASRLQAVLATVAAPREADMRVVNPLVVLPLVLAACASGPLQPPPPPPPPAAPARVVPELRPGIPAGYLGRALPNSLALLPPPPAKGSPGFAQDQAISRAAQKLRRTPR